MVQVNPLGVLSRSEDGVLAGGFQQVFVARGRCVLIYGPLTGRLTGLSGLLLTCFCYTPWSSSQTCDESGSEQLSPCAYGALLDGRAVRGGGW